MLRRSGAAAFAAAFLRLGDLPSPNFWKWKGRSESNQTDKADGKKKSRLEKKCPSASRRNRKIWADGNRKKRKGLLIVVFFIIIGVTVATVNPTTYSMHRIIFI